MNISYRGIRHNCLVSLFCNFEVHDTNICSSRYQQKQLLFSVIIVSLWYFWFFRNSVYLGTFTDVIDRRYMIGRFSWIMMNMINSMHTVWIWWFVISGCVGLWICFYSVCIMSAKFACSGTAKIFLLMVVKTLHIICWTSLSALAWSSGTVEIVWCFIKVYISS